MFINSARQAFSPHTHMGKPMKLGYDASDGLEGGLGNLR